MATIEKWQKQELTCESFPQTWRVMQEALADEVTPGLVAGFWLKSEPNHYWTVGMGKRRILPSPLPMTEETVFDIASVSKVFATATLAAALVDRGWLSWNTSLSSILPNYPYSEIQLDHLLSHTSGLTAWLPFWEKLREIFAPEPLYLIPIQKRQEKMRQLVYGIAPEFRPGEKVVYSDLSFLLLGFALEEVTQMPLDRAVQKFVWQPMGIRNAYYQRIYGSASQNLRESVAATENCSWRGGVLQGTVHDDNCWAMGGVGGHAGVFSTASELLYFSKVLLMKNFLSSECRRLFWKRVEHPSPCTRTLGWDTPSDVDSSVGRYFSKNSVGHLGYTGTSLWIDLEAELAVVLLTNRVHPSRENWKIKKFRPAFHEAIRLDLKSFLSQNKMDDKKNSIA